MTIPLPSLGQMDGENAGNRPRERIMAEQIAQQILTNFHLEQPCQCINAQARSLLLSGQYKTCLILIHSQPVNLVEDSLDLLICQATAMLFSEYSQQSIETVLAKAEQHYDAAAYEGEIIAIRAIICSYTGNPETGIKLSKIAAEKLNPDNVFFHNLIERNLGVAFTVKNDLCNANQWFEKLLMSSYHLQDWGGVLAAYNYLTYIRKVQGRLHEAETIYQKALKFISNNSLERMPHSIKIISGYGQLLMYWHQISEAKIYFEKAISLAADSDILYACTAYQNLSEAYVRENNPLAALSVLQELRQHVKGKAELYEEIHLQHTNALEARILIEIGQIDHGTEWLQTSGFEDLAIDQLFDYFGYELGLTLPIAARIYIHKSKPDRAITVLKAVIPQLIQHGANSYLIRALSALSLAYTQQGQHYKALNAITKAIALGEPENNFGDFMYFGRSLYPVINQALTCGVSTDFSFRLLTHLKIFSPCINQTAEIKRPTFLSQREIDVLTLIAEGMTNQEIGLALYLSNNTIKRHSINIYRKLNVKNRTQAASQARLLGILPVIRSNESIDFTM